MTKYASTLDISRFISDVYRRADSSTRVRMSVKAQTASCDATGTITLPAFVMPMTQRDFEVKRGQCIHEVGHVNRPEIFDLIKGTGLSMKHPFMRILNITEDASQEREQAAKYKGDMKALSDLHKYHTDDQIEYWEGVWSKCSDKSKLADEVIKTMAIYALSKEANGDWNIGGMVRLRTLIETCHPDSLALWEATKHEGWQDKIREAKTPQEAFNVAKELYERFFGKDLEEEKQKEQEQQAKGEGEGEGEGDEEQETDSTEDGEGEEDAPSSEELIEIDWDKILVSDHKDGKSQPSRINWEGKRGYENFEWFPPSEIEVIDLKKEDYTKNQIDIPLESRLVANKVRQLIQASDRIQWRTDLKHGKVNYSALYRRRMPRVGSGEWNRQLFKKKRKASGINTAITLLVDWSGSMIGAKMQHAREATVIMYDIFAKIIKVPTEILMFTTNGSMVTNGIVKSFNDTVLANEDIQGRMLHFKHWTSGNADGDSLIWACNRLNKRNEERKICIVLSDGSPSESYLDGYRCGGDADNALMTAIADIKSHMKIEMHGIGICDDNVKRYYGANAQVIHKSSELPNCLLETLKEIVLCQ